MSPPSWCLIRICKIVTTLQVWAHTQNLGRQRLQDTGKRCCFFVATSSSSRPSSLNSPLFKTILSRSPLWGSNEDKNHLISLLSLALSTHDCKQCNINHILPRKIKRLTTVYVLHTPVRKPIWLGRSLIDGLKRGPTWNLGQLKLEWRAGWLVSFTAFRDRGRTHTN